MSIKRTHNQTAMQLARFGVVGVLSTVIHVFTALYFIEVIRLSAVSGNLIGFCFSFIASYYGNKLWTFNRSIQQNQNRILHYAVVTAVGLLFNVIIMSFSVNVFSYSHREGLLIIVMLWPMINFTLSRYWVFR